MTRVVIDGLTQATIHHVQNVEVMANPKMDARVLIVDTALPERAQVVEQVQIQNVLYMEMQQNIERSNGHVKTDGS